MLPNSTADAMKKLNLPARHAQAVQRLLSILRNRKRKKPGAPDTVTWLPNRDGLIFYIPVKRDFDWLTRLISDSRKQVPLFPSVEIHARFDAEAKTLTLRGPGFEEIKKTFGSLAFSV